MEAKDTEEDFVSCEFRRCFNIWLDLIYYPFFTGDVANFIKSFTAMQEYKELKQNALASVELGFKLN